MQKEYKKIVNFRVNNSFGEPFIIIEPIIPSEDYNLKGFLAITLAQGTTIEKANEISKYLNENILDVSHTSKDLA